VQFFTAKDRLTQEVIFVLGRFIQILILVINYT
jgi:hypothetical protein